MAEQVPDSHAVTRPQPNPGAPPWLRRHVAKVVGAAVVLGAAAYLVAGPYLALLKLRSGVEARDLAQVADCVDFPALRQSLKDQLQAAMSKRANADVENKPFAALGAALAAKIVDGLVDKLVTPDGLARLLAGEEPVTGSQGAAAGDTSVRKPLEGAHYSYESLDRFAISMPTDQEGEIRFVLTRSGLQWRLSGIEMPLAK